MTLITILICLTLQRFFGLNTQIYCERCFECVLKPMIPLMKKLGPWGVILLTVVPALLVLAVAHWLLSDLYFGVFYSLFSLVILLLCMDLRDLDRPLRNYFEAQGRGDQQAALEFAKGFAENGAIVDEKTLNRAVTQEIFLKSQDRVFSVLFWYLVLGIYGATAYAMIAMLHRHATQVNLSHSPVLGKVRDLLSWLPGRLAGLSYALVGHFTVGFAYCLKHAMGGLETVQRFSVEAGLAAMIQDKDESKTALGLINRAIVLWMVVVALVTLGTLVR